MMKIRRAMLLVIVSVFLSISHAAFGGMLPNGWESYEKQEGSFEFGYDDNENAYYVKSGNYKEDRGIIKRKIDVRSFKGKKIKLTALIKTQNVNGVVYLFADTNVSKGGNHTKILDAESWRSFEVVLVVPNDLTSISLGLSLFGEGKAWIKDLQMALFLD